MTREVIVDRRIKLRDLLESTDELVVAVADMPDDKTWVVIVTPPPEASEVKVIG